MLAGVVLGVEKVYTVSSFFQKCPYMHRDFTVYTANCYSSTDKGIMLALPASMALCTASEPQVKGHFDEC